MNTIKIKKKVINDSIPRDHSKTLSVAREGGVVWTILTITDKGRKSVKEMLIVPDKGWGGKGVYVYTDKH